MRSAADVRNVRRASAVVKTWPVMPSAWAPATLASRLSMKTASAGVMARSARTCRKISGSGLKVVFVPTRSVVPIERMAPVLPGLSDSPRQLEATVAAAAEAGACFVWANIVYLKPGTKEHFMEFLGREYPQLLPRYHELFPGAYAPNAAKAPVTAAVATFKQRHGVGDRRAGRAEPPPEPVQLDLAV